MTGSPTPGDDARRREPTTPPLRVDGQTAVVTGAGRGIGMAAAIALAEAGADVVLMSRTEDELQRVAETIEGLGRKATPIPCDVTRLGQLTAAFAEVERVDVLVTSAGTNIPEPFAEVSEEHLDQLLTLNVKATFLASQQAVRRMLEQGGGGSIIHISSQMGHVGAANRTVYCATKHAVEGLTRAMAVELAAHGIRVNSIAPTFVETPMTQRFFRDEEFRLDVLRKIPLGRLGHVEDLMGAIVFLASPATKLVTGASLLVDGGWTAQ